MGTLDLNAILARRPANPANPANSGESKKEISKVSGISTVPCFCSALETLVKKAGWVSLNYGILVTEKEILSVLGVSGCREIEGAAQRVLNSPSGVARLTLDLVLRRGIVPDNWTSPVTCDRCGPVWMPAISPRVVTVCPWCDLRKAARWFPRPSMACGQCRQFIPDNINSGGGLGSCKFGHDSKWLCFPNRKRDCSDWRVAADGYKND